MTCKKCKCKETETVIKNLHDINTMWLSEDNEMMLHGKDEFGNDFELTLNTIELLEWLDIPYMKERAIEYINNLTNLT